MSRPSIDFSLRRFTRCVRAYVGTSEVVVDVLGRWRRHSVCVVREPIATFEGPGAMLDALDRAICRAGAGQGSLRGLACAIVLADAWIVYDVVPLDVIQVPADAAGAIVASTLADVAGVRPDALDVQWQWQRDGRGAFAMAIPRSLMAQLRIQLARHGLSVRSATGEFVAVYNEQRARLTGARVVFAVVRHAGTQLALLSDGAIRATGFETGRGGAAALRRSAAGAMRARGEDTAAAIEYLIDTGAPGTVVELEQVAAAGWSLVNTALGRGPRRSPMTPQRLTLDFAAPTASAYGGRVLLGVGLVALLVGGLNFALSWEQRNRGQSELATLVQRNSVQHRSARTATSADAAALRAATLVSRDLWAPWSELMRSMEASQSVDISLVRIEPVAAAGSLRITGDARHADAMIDYLEQLRAQGLAEVVLTSHQVQLQQPGKPIRFQAQARWSDLATAASSAESLGRISTPTPPEAAPSADSAVHASMPAGAFDETERFLVNSRAAR